MKSQDLQNKRQGEFVRVDVRVLFDSQLSPTDKTIYALLCASPSVSVAMLAQKANCSENTVRTAIKNLVARGVIEYTREEDERK